MSLIQMSISGAVMILVIVVIRALLLHRLPKRAFTVLWGVVLVRLLIPYTLPCPFSAYSLLAGAGSAEISETSTTPPVSDETVPPVMDLNPGNAVTPAPDISAENGSPFDFRTAVWLAGMAACAVFFTFSYIKCRIRFRESLPVESSCIDRWLSEHRLRRRISVRQSDRIAAPLTYGVFRPVILLPKNYEKINEDDLKFVLSHEYAHIRRFDAVFKLLLAAALCVHWFNPLVWAMYLIANKDIEISCDEAVITMLGETEKKRYAMTLIRMEEIKSGLAPLISHYSKNHIKERIVTIMKFKKTTTFAAAAAVFLTVGITTAFATSAQPQSDGIEQQINSTDVSASENSSAEKTPNSIQNPNVSSAEAQTNDVEAPVESTPDKTEQIPTAKKYTDEYYLEKYADYLVDTPPYGGYMILIDSDENGKQVMRYLSFDHVPDDDFPPEGGVICWNSNCEAPDNCTNNTNAESCYICGSQNCNTNHHNSSHHSENHHSENHHYKYYRF